MIKELKEFLFEASVLDLAVTVVIGAAFSAIVTSLVEDAITPLFLNSALRAAGVEKIAEFSWHDVAYDSFLNAITNSLIAGTTLLFIAKAVNAASAFGKKQDRVEEEAAPTQEEFLIEIRDLLEKE